jgi:hypothetical protein
MESESQWRKKRETCGVRTIALVPEHVRLILSRQKSKSGLRVDRFGDPMAAAERRVGAPYTRSKGPLCHA